MSAGAKRKRGGADDGAAETRDEERGVAAPRDRPKRGGAAATTKRGDGQADTDPEVDRFLEEWERDFDPRRHSAAPVPEVRTPQRFKTGEDRYDLPAPGTRFHEALKMFTVRLNGPAGKRARHPKKLKKGKTSTAHYLEWEKAVKRLKNLRKRILRLILPRRVLDPNEPAHRLILLEVAAVRQEARQVAGALYSAMQPRFWRNAWDDMTLRKQLLAPALEKGSAYSAQVAGRSTREIWEDDRLRNKVLVGLPRNEGGKAVLRFPGNDNEILLDLQDDTDDVVFDFGDSDEVVFDFGDHDATSSLAGNEKADSAEVVEIRVRKR